MLVILSPAKTQDFTAISTLSKTAPMFAGEVNILVNALKKLSPQELELTLGISPKLAKLNFERYMQFTPHEYNCKNSKACIFAYQGDVYQGLQANSLSNDDLSFANDHLLILSGLYGVLRPLEAIQAYRLEMSTKLITPGHKDLYSFWHNILQNYINERLKQEQILLNLASNEYSSALNFSKLSGTVIQIEFKDWHKDRFKVIGLLAKKARGMMARFIIQNRLAQPESLKEFTMGGYQFQPALSTSNHYIFHRQ